MDAPWYVKFELVKKDADALTALTSTFVTYSGIEYRPFNPRVHDVYIEDIAHSLAHQCRYAGHIKKFYSVAEHSVVVSRLCPIKQMLEALLHDAAEAYCQDVIAPVKRFLPEYQALIALNEGVIRQAFGLPAEQSETVTFVDKLVGDWERSMLTKHILDPDETVLVQTHLTAVWDDYWHGEVPYTKRLPSEFQSQSPEAAKDAFLRMFNLLTYKTGASHEERLHHQG